MIFALFAPSLAGLSGGFLVWFRVRIPVSRSFWVYVEVSGSLEGFGVKCL